MTAQPRPQTGPDDEDREGSAQLRRAGRTLLGGIHAASRSVKLYPAEHQTVQRALAELAECAEDIRRAQDELEIGIQGDFIFINGTRLRLDLSNYASFARVLEMFRAAGVGRLRVIDTASARDWLGFVNALDAAGGVPDAAAEDLELRLRTADVFVFDVAPPQQDDGDQGVRVEAQAAAKRTYAQSVALTKDVIHSVRMGRAPSSKKLKRAVQSIVDEVLNEETSLIGLTTLREYDEYTYTHSVNVCIFAVALGKRLAMNKLQLYELGLAALLHDIGKSRVSLELLRKAGSLDEDEWRRITMHPWMGVLTLFQLRGAQEPPYRAMVVAHEHHMKCDLSGYPRSRRPRKMTMASKIVAVADGYDAATSRRVYQANPLPPSAVLQEMRDNPGRGMDQVVVKAFVALLGLYPPGTLVVLDTLELAVVRAANPSPELLSRPQVVIVSDSRGNLLAPPVEADLAARTPDGEFARKIIKTADPDRYGIRVSDYLI